VAALSHQSIAATNSTMIKYVMMITVKKEIKKLAAY